MLNHPFKSFLSPYRGKKWMSTLILARRNPGGGASTWIPPGFWHTLTLLPLAVGSEGNTYFTLPFTPSLSPKGRAKSGFPCYMAFH